MFSTTNPPVMLFVPLSSIIKSPAPVALIYSHVPPLSVSVSFKESYAQLSPEAGVPNVISIPEAPAAPANPAVKTIRQNRTPRTLSDFQ